MKVIKRYAWEDALIEAQQAGVIKNGALLVALKLARAINWSPKNGRPSGLYWKNQDAFDSVGVSRTSYYDHRRALFDAGFFKEVKGNLIPTVPSVGQTEEPVVRTERSVVRTGKSVGRKSFSDDAYSEDELSEDVSSEDTTAASAPVDIFLNRELDDPFLKMIEQVHLEPSNDEVGERAPVRSADRAKWAQEKHAEWLEDVWPSNEQKIPAGAHRSEGR